MAMIRLLAQPAKQKQLKLIVSVFWCMDGLPRFDGPVLISDLRILGPPLTPAPNGRFGSKPEKLDASKTGKARCEHMFSALPLIVLKKSFFADG
jgi:hypothetical protein